MGPMGNSWVSTFEYTFCFYVKIFLFPNFYHLVDFSFPLLLLITSGTAGTAGTSGTAGASGTAGTSGSYCWYF